MRTLAIILAVVLTGCATTPPVTGQDPLHPNRLDLDNRAATLATEDGRSFLRLDAREGMGLAMVPGSDFATGTLTVQVRGRDVPQGSFLGLAFGGGEEGAFEVVYLRPFNFRAEDPVFRARAVQYMSVPDFHWPRLRREQPGRFEAAVQDAPAADAWVTLRVEVADTVVRVFVGDATTPTLVAPRLAPGGHGPVGLWVGTESPGEFRDLVIEPAAAPPPGSLLFQDDFETGLGEPWLVADDRRVRVVDSSDPDRGRVLELTPGGARVRALLRGSEGWGPVVVEGRMMFPDPGHSYLGFIWAYDDHDGRADYASAYVKGNGSYAQANPHRDDNPARALYPEHRVALQGDAAVRIGEWQRFRLEVGRGAARLFVGPGSAPALTFDLFERRAGRIGFRPRVVGSRVWLDDLRVTALGTAPVPQPWAPRPGAVDPRLLTGWEALGPLAAADPDLEAGLGHDDGRWRPFPADPRGAVVTGRLADYLGPNTVVYLRTRIDAPAEGEALLELATVDDLALWLNGEFLGHVPAGARAWPDFLAEPDRPRSRAALRLQPGENVLVARVRGGRYASGGFFAALVPPPCDGC